MNKTLLRFGLVSLVALSAFQGRVSAQAAPAAEPAAPAAAPVAAEPAPAPMAEPAPAPMAEPVAAAPAEEPAAEAAPIAGWFRIDTDSFGTQLWAGATFPMDSWGLATDIYVVGTFGEFDIGPTFTMGGLTLTPMLGLNIDFAPPAQHAVQLVPQFYTYFDSESLYFESWIQIFLADMLVKGSTDLFHTRNFLLFKASSVVAIGPEFDIYLNIANAGTNNKGKKDGLTLLPVGPHVKLSYGTNSFLELFAGYDVVSSKWSDNALSGRFTFVHNW